MATTGGFEPGTGPAERRALLDQKRKTTSLEESTATLEATVATNTADIATNTADIATNTADIATNTAAIAGLGSWQSWTPTLTQNVTVTATVTYAKYTWIGDTIHFAFELAVTGSGSALSVVKVSLPQTAAAASGHPVGSGWVRDSTTYYPGVALLESTTTVSLIRADTLTTTMFNSVTLASGDTVSISGTYEAA